MGLVKDGKKRKLILFDAETEVPTVPTREDPDSPHWVHTDILRGELAVNLKSRRVWTRDDFGIIELLTSESDVATGIPDSSCCNIYIGPEVYAGLIDTYQNDLLIDVTVDRIILFVDELRYPLLGDSAKGTHDEMTGTITLSGFNFPANCDIFIIIKPVPEIYVGPEEYAGETDTYQNDLLIDIPVERVILFVNELRYPLLGDSAKATYDDTTGTITLITGLTFNENSDIFIIIKP